MPDTQPQRHLRARLGGLALAAQRDPREYTSKAREVFRDSFLNAQPPDLPEAERVRRAEASRRLYFTRLAMRSAQARAAQRDTAAQRIEPRDTVGDGL
jgi:hypothetical protein